MTIVFEPNFEIGETVYLKINPEKKMTVDGFQIFAVNNAGEVTHFDYMLSDGEGLQYAYSNYALESVGAGA